jgi:hypothetical protein
LPTSQQLGKSVGFTSIQYIFARDVWDEVLPHPEQTLEACDRNVDTLTILWHELHVFFCRVLKRHAAHHNELAMYVGPGMNPVAVLPVWGGLCEFWSVFRSEQ